MNSLSTTKRTLAFPLAVITEVEFDTRGDDGYAFCCKDIDIAELTKELVQAKVFSLSISADGPLVIVTRFVADIGQAVRVKNILDRYCIRGGLLQDEWFHRQFRQQPEGAETT